MRTVSLIVASLLSPLALAAPTTLPNGPIPDGLGVNIHFTDPRPGEMQMLADGGFTIVRTDFVWDRTEHERGVYDFSAYDRLMTQLDQHHVRPLFILDYGNPLYDEGASPHTEEARAAMAKWAVAAVQHFKGRGVIWEMWNEPNIGFWKPRPNADDYAKLALTVARAIRAAAPQETLIGPGCSGVDFTFLETCFKAGLLEQWDAVSVHPYRQGAPETVIDDYTRLRDLIVRYAPAGKQVPILSGEWGYSSAWDGFDEQRQAAYLPRQWLINLSQGVPISIWYDWHDDGTDAKDAEHHFGTVHHDARTAAGQTVFEPKGAYQAAQLLNEQLRGFRFDKRLDVPNASDVYLLLFSNDEGKQRLVVWTSGAERDLQLPLGKQRFSREGENLQQASSFAIAGAQAVRVTQRVQYLTPAEPSDLLRVAAAWQTLPLLIRDRTRATLPIRTTLRNPLDHPITVVGGDEQRQTIEPGQTGAITFTVKLTRSSEAVPISVALKVEGVGEVQQSTHFIATNPRRVTIEPSVAGPWIARIQNPSGEAFAGTISFQADWTRKIHDIRFGAGEREHRVPIDVAEDAQGKFKVAIDLTDGKDAPPLSLGWNTFQRVCGPLVTNGRVVDGWSSAAEGDETVAATTSLGIAPGPAPNTQAIQVRYQFDAGWKFAVVRPPEAQRRIEGKPKALLLWLWTDGNAVTPRLRFTDSGNETFQPNAAEPITGNGWHLVRFPLDGSDHPGHWGGDHNGTLDYPIRFETLLLLDNVARTALTGTARFAAPVLVYE